MRHELLFASVLIALLVQPLAAQSREPTHRIENAATAFAAGDFGRSCFALGDFDGDGFADYAISAQNWPVNVYFGRVYVYSGRTSALIRTFDGDQQSSGFGLAAADLGDINGDGFRDLAVSAFDHDSGGFLNNGRVFAFSGATGAVLWTSSGGASGRTLGKAMGAISDITGDGIADLAAGERGFTGIATGTGRVVFLSGANGVMVGSVEGSVQFENLGSTLGTRAGTGIVYAGAGNSSKVYQIPAVAVFGQTPIVAHAAVPSAVSSARINILFAAGAPTRLAIGRPDADVAGVINAGTIDVYAIGSIVPMLTLAGTYQDEQIGMSLATGRDVDGDGSDEIVFTSAVLGQAVFAVRARVVAVTGTLVDDVIRSDGTGSVVSSIPDVTGDGRGEWLLATSSGVTAVFQSCLFSKGLALTSSSGVGGGYTATMTIDAGPFLGGRPYLQAYGVSGAAPGTFGPPPWPLIPLNIDAVTTLAFSLAGSSILPDPFGTLTAAGTKTTTLALPASIVPALTGLGLTTAAVITDPTGVTVVCATNPITILFP